jgi:transcription elongation factor Elf1
LTERRRAVLYCPIDGRPGCPSAECRADYRRTQGYACGDPTPCPHCGAPTVEEIEGTEHNAATFTHQCRSCGLYVATDDDEED